ncbi:MAG TPA: hypothetical protein VGI81_27840 [Tepidisphaeraceae bacterium]|jgi:hypothetical protein
MKSTKLMLAAAMTGLLAGSAARAATTATAAPARAAQSITSPVKGSSLQTKTTAKAGTLLADEEKGKHDCKGKNDCKGQGGCKSSDNGCKGKNSCKGKGGCSTKDSGKDSGKLA